MKVEKKTKILLGLKLKWKFRESGTWVMKLWRKQKEDDDDDDGDVAEVSESDQRKTETMVKKSIWQTQKRCLVFGFWFPRKLKKYLPTPAMFCFKTRTTTFFFFNLINYYLNHNQWI